ncbi:hypothetical protein DL764_005215 [Monosporascus ibericus]|uniref:HECT-type E3 ubiquitin transferase n=1 Tax=Monosporascus ibericus TaxID=155417 RepID=A0A4V1XAN0_9PEZI|nr:hypothetical protein DL764_005215 [Monosporascus ibericus]
MTRNVLAHLSEYDDEHGHGHGPGPGHSALEAEVLAALWEQVPFPRLPFDSPSELRDFVVEVEDPKRVYTIHRASRRYYLQLLVERFVVQLRYGCGVSDCSTSSCFTCRRRLAGKAPIRRYNPTSARTLAVYLAGQDNPESRLCPNLQPPTKPSDSVKPLTFSAKCTSASAESKRRRFKPANGHGHSPHDAPKEKLRGNSTKRAPGRPSSMSYTPTTANLKANEISLDPERKGEPPANPPGSTQVLISEKEVSKDYRSFAANVFGTVAFKMLEWLTPNTLEAIAEKAEAAVNGSDSPQSETTANSSSREDDLFATSTVSSSSVKPPKALDTESDEQSPDPENGQLRRDEWQLQLDGVNGDDASSSSGVPPRTPEETFGNQPIANSLDSTSELDQFLPQSMSRLNIQAIDFLCDVLQEDATCETHLLEPSAISSNETAKYRSSPLKSWKRERRTTKPYPQNLRLQWKFFFEQSIFSVLSDPRAVLESFTGRDGLIDSHSLWYCMLRLTRVAPSLVFDSLWIALSDLFAPPKPLQSSRSPTSKLFPRSRNSFTNAEAGFLLSICLHALVAAAPLVTDSRQLVDMSRIRAHGLTLTNGGAGARQPTSLCLQYEDAFTDDLALRLAKRLLAVIPARRRFDLLMEFDRDLKREQEKDVVEVFLTHLESASQSPLIVSKAERSMHEKRVPILVLDWARAVMLREWEGKADVSGDGPFGGALALTAAMYQKRQSLLLGDMSFFTEYFGERLDPIQMPVSWLTFNPAQRIHLLDHPYLFTPAARVSYFRAINFSHMSRAYEESSSLQERIHDIVERTTLVVEPHQRNLLQDMLKVSSSKYLILSIGRETVLEDAFDQLWRREERELMRPLKVHLGEDTGEEGFDSGGVQQEFFRLAIAEALNPDYGAFTVDDRTHMAWFQPGSVQPEWKFELIGLLISLAVYNGLTLPVTFPKALYQKLLGEPVTELHHIADGWPDLANGLTTLLEWNERDGAVEDVFALTYEFSTSMFDQPISRKMQPHSERDSEEEHWPQFSGRPDAEPLPASNPSDAPAVTGDNRNAYVSDYIRYLTTASVEPQFAALARGFRRCLHTKALDLLTPALLQSLVEGEQQDRDIDVAELRRAARYVGWDASHRAVRDFWAVVRRFDPAMRRRLLEFVTASDRVPVGGLRNVQFVVQRNGEENSDRGHLPTAYTCYGTLLLPEYRDREVLRERLCMALENAQGFGFA